MTIRRSSSSGSMRITEAGTDCQMPSIFSMYSVPVIMTTPAERTL